MEKHKEKSESEKARSVFYYHACAGMHAFIIRQFF